MRIASPIRFFLAAAMTTWLLLPAASMAQRCERKATITLDTDVYENVPRFITGQGWQGNRIASLPKNTGVFVCREQKVDFGLSSRDWLQIAYKNNKGPWVYGWILKETAKIGAHGVPGVEDRIGYSFFSHAVAAAPSATRTTTQVATSADDAPPLPSIGDAGASGYTSPTSWSDPAVLYGPLFIAVLLGMVAKAVVDWLEAPKAARLQDHARSGFIAFLVSPMVFLGFLNAGHFSVTTQTTLVLLLLAFQNGFFWQAVLKRNSSSNQQNG